MRFPLRLLQSLVAAFDSITNHVDSITHTQGKVNVDFVTTMHILVNAGRELAPMCRNIDLTREIRLDMLKLQCVDTTEVGEAF